MRLKGLDPTLVVIDEKWIFKKTNLYLEPNFRTMAPRLNPAPDPKSKTDLFSMVVPLLIKFSKPKGMEAEMQLPYTDKVSMILEESTLKLLLK